MYGTNNERTIPLDKTNPAPFFQRAVQQVAQNTQAPEDMVQLCALAAASIATQRLINVRLPRIGVVPTSLMLMVVAKSGERKSTVESKFFNAIREFEADKRAVYDKDYNDWKEKHEIWQIERKALQKLFEKTVNKNQQSEEIDAIKTNLRQIISEEPREPSPAKILYDDSTVQALYRGLQNSLPFAGLVSSEGGSVLKSGAFNDMAKLNSLWSGESITVDRVSSENINLNNVRLTTLIMVQPEILDEFINKKGTQARGSGLMARFLFSSGKSTQGTRIMEGATHSQKWDYLENFNYLIKEFLKLSYESMLKEKFEPKIIELSPKAEELWRDYYNDTEKQILSGQKYDDFGDHASKLAENAGRIAAILNFFNWNGDKIQLEIMEHAIYICKNLSNNFLVFFDMQPQEIQDAKILLEWLNESIRHQYYNHRSIMKNDILKYGPSSLRKSERLDKALNVLSHEGSIYLFKEKRTTYVGIYPTRNRLSI